MSSRSLTHAPARNVALPPGAEKQHLAERSEPLLVPIAHLNERARKSIAQEQATNSDFEQSSGFREALRPPTQKWGLRDCSRIALGHLDEVRSAHLDSFAERTL